MKINGLFDNGNLLPSRQNPRSGCNRELLSQPPFPITKKIVVHYIKQTSRSDILISFLVHCLGTFFFHCLPSFTHNYEGRHEEASLPIASSRCRSNLSDWRSESEEIKSPVVKIPPLSVFEDDDLFFWDFFFILLIYSNRLAFFFISCVSG